jgi:MFS family permease
MYSRVAGVAGLGFLISVTASMIDRFYPILATEYAGMSEAQAGLVYLGSAVVIMVAGPSFGWLSDRYGRRPTTALRTIANAGSSLLYLVAPNPVGFTTGKLMDDGGKAGFRPAWGALKADISGVKKSQRAQMMGLMDVGDDAGDLAGPIAGGMLWSAWGAPGLLIARIVLAGVTELYAATIFWRRPDSRRVPDQVSRVGPLPAEASTAQWEVTWVIHEPKKRFMAKEFPEALAWLSDQMDRASHEFAREFPGFCGIKVEEGYAFSPEGGYHRAVKLEHKNWLDARFQLVDTSFRRLFPHVYNGTNGSTKQPGAEAEEGPTEAAGVPAG